MKLKLLPSTIPHSFLLRDSNFNASSSSSSSSLHRHKLNFNFIVTSRSKKHHRNNDAQGSDSQSTPPRITSNAKQNLQILKALKEYQKPKSIALRPTSYRKKKAEKADTRHHHHEDDDLDRDPTSSPYRTNKLGIIDNGAEVLLVDGYNVCGYWIKLKKHFMSGQLELARQKLIDELQNFRMLREVKVVVVFDAMMSGFPTHKESYAGIDIVFSSETSADAWIEKEVLALKKDGCPTVRVATSDRSQQEAASWAGAYVWSCKTLITEWSIKLKSSHNLLTHGLAIKEIEELQKEADEMLREQRSTFEGRLLKHSLDAKVVGALRNLRQQLVEKESKEKKIKLKLQ